MAPSHFWHFWMKGELRRFVKFRKLPTIRRQFNWGGVARQHWRDNLCDRLIPKKSFGLAMAKVALTQISHNPGSTAPFMEN